MTLNITHPSVCAYMLFVYAHKYDKTVGRNTYYATGMRRLLCLLSRTIETEIAMIG